MTAPAVPLGFAAAVGAAGPLPLRVEHAIAGVLAEGELDQPFALIGSDPRCEIALNDPALPARLACLQVLDGVPTVFRLDTLEPFPITPAEPWASGPFTLRLTSPTPSHPPARPNVRLSLTAHTAAGGVEIWPIDERVAFIGRSAECDVQMADAGLAGVHAYLMCTADGAWVVDLLTDGNTAVNGEPVRVARLNDGDELTVGTARLVCRVDAARKRAANGPPVGVRESSGVRQAEITRPAFNGTGLKPKPKPADEWGDFPDPVTPTVGPAPAQEKPVEVVSLTPAPATVPASPPAPVAPPPEPPPAPSPATDPLAELREQMQAEFRRTMGEMAAEFEKLKAEQVAAVRAEMDRLAELRVELEGLRANLTAGTPLPSARPLYQPLPEPEEATPLNDPDRYDWVVTRAAAVEAERNGIWTRLRGLFAARTG